MPNRNQPQVHIDRIHSHAICDGIGERIRDEFNRMQMQGSPHLDHLLGRLPELDQDDSPSIVPQIAN